MTRATPMMTMTRLAVYVNMKSYIHTYIASLSEHSDAANAACGEERDYSVGLTRFCEVFQWKSKLDISDDSRDDHSHSEIILICEQTLFL